MPGNVVKQQLSGSTDGRRISVAAVATPGTVIHQASAVANEFDEIYLDAMNIDTSARELIIEWGGTASADHIIYTLQPKSGLHVVVPGRVLENSLIARAYCLSADVITIGGYIHRLTP